MDREIPKEVRNKERNKKIIRYGGIGVASVIVISVLISFMRTGVKTKDLVFSTVDKGTIEVSVSASGKVVPAFEEIINSPINTRIVEIYKKGGASVSYMLSGYYSLYSEQKIIYSKLRPHYVNLYTNQEVKTIEHDE